MKRMACVACLAVLALPISAAAEDLAAVQKKITDAWAGTKSVSAKVTKKLEQVMPNGNRIRSEGTGTYEMLRDGDKVKFRMETSLDTAVRIKGSESDMKVPSGATTVIDDGEYIYSLQSPMGKPNASREKSQGAAKRELATSDRKSMFETLARENELKVVTDDRVSGVDCYRIEATAKGPRSAGQASKSVYAFAKDSGMLMQVRNYDDKGEDIGHETYSDVKINEKLDPQRFVFKAPEGVTVKDRGPGVPPGQRPAGPPKPPASGPAAPAPPTTAPAKP